MQLSDEIARIAYELYEKSGCLDGCHLDNWFEAERIVMAQQRIEKKLKAELSSPPERKKESTTKRSSNKPETKRKKN
jgi:hypothetical protein